MSSQEKYNAFVYPFLLYEDAGSPFEMWLWCRVTKRYENAVMLSALEVRVITVIIILMLLLLQLLARNIACAHSALAPMSMSSFLTTKHNINNDVR